MTDRLLYIMRKLQGPCALLLAVVVCLTSCDDDGVEVYTVPKRKQQTPRGAGGAVPSWSVPDGWKDLGASGMRLAAFDAGGVQVTVIALGSEAGDVRANVQRWRSQLGLSEASREEVGSHVTKVKVGGAEGSYIDIEGGKNGRMIAAMVERGGRVWFFKMMGDRAIVAKQKENFDKFIASVRFGD